LARVFGLFLSKYRLVVWESMLILVGSR